MSRQLSAKKGKPGSRFDLRGRKLTTPRFLRAVETIVYNNANEDRKKEIHHYVEWHTGKAETLLEPRSHTQLCVYLDLGEVGTCVQILSCLLRVAILLSCEKTFVIARDMSLGNAVNPTRNSMRTVAIFRRRHLQKLRLTTRTRVDPIPSITSRFGVSCCRAAFSTCRRYLR